MKAQKMLIGLVIAAFLVSACGKNKKTMLTVSNTETILQSHFPNGNVAEKWDVHVIVNGVDCGLIKAGESFGPVEVTGKNLEFELFQPDTTCFSKAVYYTTSLGRWCVRNDDAKAQTFRDTDGNIPLYDKDWTLEIGYGATAP